MPKLDTLFGPEILPTLDASFVRLIGDRAVSKEAVPVEIMTAENGKASVSVRGRGGHIIEAWLVNPETGNKESVLYSAEEKIVGKLAASHIASPFGPNDGPGGQHGPGRWQEYHLFPSPERPHGLFLQGKETPVDGPVMRRWIELPEQNMLVIRDIVDSHTPESTATSLAEHLYLAVDEESLKKIRVNDELLSNIIPDEVLCSVLEEGKPFHWKEAPSVLTLQLGDRRFELSATALVSSDEGEEVPIVASYVIWHKPGTDSICFEPVVGFADGKGDKAHLPGYGSLSLTTVLRIPEQSE